MKTIFLIIVSAVLSFSQSYRIDKVTGSVKFLNSNDEWIKIETGIELPANSIIITEKNSSVKISGGEASFILKEESALLVSSVKQMTFDELLLALAMDDILNAPRKKESIGKTTAVYGTREGAAEKILLSDDFGIKRIKGAKQLAENGFKESAVVTAKDIFRKYPATKLNAGYRIYFADILYDFGLYHEAYEEYTSIKDLTLSKTEQTEVDEKISLLNKKLVNN